MVCFVGTKSSQTRGKWRQRPTGVACAHGSRVVLPLKASTPLGHLSHPLSEVAVDALEHAAAVVPLRRRAAVLVLLVLVW